MGIGSSGSQRQVAIFVETIECTLRKYSKRIVRAQILFFILAIMKEREVGSEPGVWLANFFLHITGR